MLLCAVHAGMVVASGPASIICAPTNSTLKLLERAGSLSPASWTGPDMLVDYNAARRVTNNTSNSTSGNKTEVPAVNDNIVLVAVQCVHKGALACRRNHVDAKSGISRCVVAVKVPPQPKADNKTLAPCQVTNGFRWDSGAAGGLPAATTQIHAACVAMLSTWCTLERALMHASFHCNACMCTRSINTCSTLFYRKYEWLLVLLSLVQSTSMPCLRVPLLLVAAVSPATDLVLCVL
jgi:hypothetical protein